MHKPLTLLLIAFSLLFAALVMRTADLAWMALPFLLYLGMGFLQAPLADEIRLQATRTVEQREAAGIPTAEVRVKVVNLGQTIIRLGLSDPLQPGMTITEGKLNQPAVLKPGESACLQYTFQTERGHFAWQTVRAVIGDPFGLLETVLDLPAEAQFQISPELNRYRPFPLRPQHTLHSSGSIPARLGGSGTDFWGVREYQPGDPLRRLDWRLTARHPHRFFTQEFEHEEIADIGLILDARKKVDVRVGEDTLFEYIVRATVSLAETFLRQGNRVSLLAYQQHWVSVFPGYGKRQLNRILRTLAQVTPEEDGNLNSLQLVPVQMFSSRSLIVVLSPLASGDWRLFPRLRAYGYQVLLISPDRIDFARPLLPADPNTQLALRLTQLERQIELANVRQLWIPVIDWHVNQPLAPLVRNALGHYHIQRQR